AGLTGPTTLVVEALDSGCPFQGFLAGEHLQAKPHQTFYTLDELQAAAADGETFINGQYDVDHRPRPIARSFLQVEPQPHNPADWDWYQGFSAGFSFGDGVIQDGGDPWSVRRLYPEWDIGGYSLDKPNGILVFSYAPFLGQFWTAFDDTAS